MLSKLEERRNHIQMIDLDAMVPANHLVRKVERVVDFGEVYEMLSGYYCEDNGRPSVDPVVLVKIVLLQRLFGLPSLRRTVSELEVNIAYRWFLGFDFTTPVPHFATVSYAFATRFPSEVFEQIFSWILEKAIKKGLISAKTIFVDATHVKANANKNKNRKVVAHELAKVYDRQLREEINAERVSHGKKPFDKDDSGSAAERTVTVSTTDPEAGLFHKGDHKVVFAYTAHVACDEHNFVLGCEVTPGNVHDSTVFDRVYAEVLEKFEEVETVAVDAGYKTPWICKKVLDDGREISVPYKRPMTKKGFFKKNEYVYDGHCDGIICPRNQLLTYSTTNRQGYREYRSDPTVCKSCPERLRCTQSRNCQKVVTRHLWDSYIEEAEAFRHTSKGRSTYNLRSQTIERVFADAKEKHAMRYTLYRGLKRVKNSIVLTFAAMNLKKLAMRA